MAFRALKLINSFKLLMIFDRFSFEWKRPPFCKLKKYFWWNSFHFILILILSASLNRIASTTIDMKLFAWEDEYNTSRRNFSLLYLRVLLLLRFFKSRSPHLKVTYWNSKKSKSCPISMFWRCFKSFIYTFLWHFSYITQK